MPSVVEPETAGTPLLVEMTVVLPLVTLATVPAEDMSSHVFPVNDEASYHPVNAVPTPRMLASDTTPPPVAMDAGCRFRTAPSEVTPYTVLKLAIEIGPVAGVVLM